MRQRKKSSKSAVILTYHLTRKLPTPGQPNWIIKNIKNPRKKILFNFGPKKAHTFKLKKKQYYLKQLIFNLKIKKNKFNTAQEIIKQCEIIKYYIQ